MKKESQKQKTAMYQPSRKILENYAQVLVNFALNDGKGIKRGDVVRVTANESAKPLYAELRKAIIRSGGHVVANYLPDDSVEYNFSRDFYDNANSNQLEYVARNMMAGMVKDIDHSITIISETHKRALEGVDSKKIMKFGASRKFIMDALRDKESAGKFTWTLALYGTPEMAAEVGMTHRAYWDQIIKACFLDAANPIAEWRKAFVMIQKYQNKLNKLDIESVHVVGPDVDLHLTIPSNRKWVGGSGRNIPSFEIFTSPDWRGTNGWIKFSEPLYRYGNLITDVYLEFRDGVVVNANASQGQDVLRAMIATEGADKVGEFSLTDKRLSRITKFMGETLYDENVGGKNGNTHIALGNSYHDCYKGDIAKTKPQAWKSMGFNESSVHTDIVSTTNRTVTATTKKGATVVIYKDGEFCI
jgi:aminopeptidase